MTKKKISHMVVMGDSLSDRGTADRAYVLGCLPMSWLSGLTGTSPQGRFTNGYTWADGITAIFSSSFMIKEIQGSYYYRTRDDMGRVLPKEERHLNALNALHRNYATADISDVLSKDKKLLVSLRGRYSSDDISDAILSKDIHIFNYLTKDHIQTHDDIADALISKNKQVMKHLECSYSLDNDLRVKYKGKDFIRSYNQGGLTAYNYSWTPSISITRFFSRIILPTLSDKRKQFFDDDAEYQVSRKYKANTLIIEWSGANDLITVNARPTKGTVDKAIKGRVKNIELLIQNGYRSFTLFNLPDLSLTPRFQNMTGANGEEERRNAKDCSVYFNEQLALACEKLQLMFPHSSLDVFDVNSIFEDACADPEKYGFERNKMHQPYKTSVDFEMRANKTSPAKGYMFWDDVHPTADLHAILAAKFYEKYNPQYEIVKPEEIIAAGKDTLLSEAQLCTAFSARYSDKLAKDQNGFFTQYKKSNICYRTANLEEIFKHAFCENGTRTKEVLCELHWIDNEGLPLLNNPLIKKAFNGAKIKEFDNAPYP